MRPDGRLSPDYLTNTVSRSLTLRLTRGAANLQRRPVIRPEIVARNSVITQDRGQSSMIVPLLGR
jgi:hypothetical protein